MALTFHALLGQPCRIGLRSVELALGWCDLLEAHARRAYGSARVAKADAARALLTRIRAGALGTKGCFSLRDVYRPQWSALDSKTKAESAAEMLADFYYLRAERVDTGGRPTLIYHVNPKALR